jgi:SAM-dependent methyltransferase
MSFDTLIAVSQRLNASLEALAALGAELRIRQDGLTATPEVRKLLQEAVGAIEPDLLDQVSDDQSKMVLSFIQAFFRQAVDLLDNPARPPGWTYDDPVVLQAQGQASRLVVRAIEAFAKQRSQFAPTLRSPGAFLDVGSGVAWLAIEAAKSWPALKVVGIDPWEPAMALARKNVADTGMAGRIELRQQSIQQFDDRDAFTLAWLAGPFIPRAIVEDAIGRILRALKRGGWLAFGLYASPPTPLGVALTTLRVVRGGGHPWTVQEAEQQLRAAGFESVETFASGTPILLVVGRRA